MIELNTACPRNCLDCCALKAYVNRSGELIKVTGDREHPVTRGYLCPKGAAYREIVYHPQRLLHPLVKKNGRFEKTGWEETLNLVAKGMDRTLKSCGPEGMFHYQYCGSENITKNIAHYFFNALGGVTGVKGDLCCGAGIAAQQYDMGGLRQNDLTDLPNAGGCVLWGRNVKDTNGHALPFIEACRDGGGKLALVNPLETGLENRADLIVRPRPGTDAALALGICRLLITEKNYDLDFVSSYTSGFAAFESSLEDYTLDNAAAITGLDAAEVRKLALFFRENTPVTTLIGYGLQRYKGGGNTIRSIDALAALTGNIGRKGGGVSYCSDAFWELDRYTKGPPPPRKRRSLDLTNLAGELPAAQDPPVKMAFISSANPVVSGPDSALMQKALRNVETLVVIDMFMTDTATEADIILPCTTFLEEESVKVSSWSPDIFYCRQAIEPRGEACSDEDIFAALAQKMELDNFPWAGSRAYLDWVLEALEKLGVDRKTLIEKGYARRPGLPAVAWEDKKFDTPSGKFEFYSQKANMNGQSPVARYIPPVSSASRYPYQLLTPHSRYRIHSQFQHAPSIARLNPYPRALLNPWDLTDSGLKEGEEAVLYNEHGSIKVRLYSSPEMIRGVISLESGWSVATGACANFLIPPLRTDMGGCGALYDVKVAIRR